MSDLQDARDVALMVLMSKSKPSVDEVLAVLADLVEAARKYANSQQIVNKQAADDGLWFAATTAPEAYLQQELRRLHAAIEGVTENE